MSATHKRTLADFYLLPPPSPAACDVRDAAARDGNLAMSLLVTSMTFGEAVGPKRNNSAGRRSTAHHTAVRDIGLTVHDRRRSEAVRISTGTDGGSVINFYNL
ncbi:hypothetical protein Salat_1856300 [Sesamum alatum]|uniref:Uncharacterized protein n=1 Tax=Sesamum alatum TaxID=300844 RepID=A0AAE1Y2X1_9LAMI|nr:hypothetical protein Salat_1856300 [Sesamum alatum]